MTKTLEGQLLPGAFGGVNSPLGRVSKLRTIRQCARLQARIVKGVLSGAIEGRLGNQLTYQLESLTRMLNYEKTEQQADELLKLMEQQNEANQSRQGHGYVLASAPASRPATHHQGDVVAGDDERRSEAEHAEDDNKSVH